MNRTLLLVFILVSSVLYFYAILRDQPKRVDLVGKPAPNFTLQNEKGESLALETLRGKVVLVHFWATWCAPCAEELPMMGSLVKRFSPEEFALVAVSVDEGGAKSVEEFRRKVRFDFPVYFDSDQKVVDSYGTFRLPESYLVDRTGTLVRKIIGPQDWGSAGWIEGIGKLLVRQAHHVPLTEGR